MKKTVDQRYSVAAAVLYLACFYLPSADAEQVYKCVEGGKTRFTSIPSEGQGCQSIELKVPQPNPVDVARQQEALRQYAHEEQAKRKQREDLEAQRRKQVTELGKAVASAPVLKPPTKGAGGKGKKN